MGKHRHLVLCEWVCTASIVKLATFPSACGQWSQLCPLTTQLTWGWAAHTPPRGCWAGAQAAAGIIPECWALACHPELCRSKKKRRCGSSQEQEHLQILPCSWDNQSIKLTCKQVLWASTRVMGQTSRFASRDLHSSLGLTCPYLFFSAINCPFSSAFLEQNLKFIHYSKISMTKNRKVIWKQPCQTIWGTSMVPTTTINCPISHYMPYSFFR